MEWHILCGASGVRRGSRRNLVIDRLEVPGKTLQTHCRCGLESSRNGTIVIVHVLVNEIELRITVAILYSRGF